MRKRKGPAVDFKCDKCGEPQPANKEKSNANWNVFNTNENCSCGGKFSMHVDGVKI